MAFKLPITLRSGAAGDYIRISTIRVDEIAREIGVVFSLYQGASKASEAKDSPIQPVFAKLRLSGAKFDEYFPAKVMDKLKAAIYEAAKSEGIVCDVPPSIGADGKPKKSLFADAENV